MENHTVGPGPLTVGQFDICRLCMKTHEYYLNIFASNEEFKMTIGKAIQDLLVIEVSQGDSLPETVCCPCVTKLMEFREFREMCIKSAREFGRHASMQPITCPVKVEILEDEFLDEGERNELNEFVDDQESAPSNGTSNSFEAGVQNGDSNELHEENYEIEEEENVMEDYCEGATVFIESSTVMLAEQCPVESKGVPVRFRREGENRSVNMEEKSPVPNEACDPLALENLCPVKDKCMPMQLPGGVTGRNWSNAVNFESRVSVVLNDQLDPLSLEKQTDAKEVCSSDFLGEGRGCEEEGNAEKECNEDVALCSELGQFVVRYQVDSCNKIGGIAEESANNLDKIGAECTLIRHQNIRIGVERFKCDLCGQGFNTMTNLQRHVLTHPDLKAFKCDLCGNSYRYSWDLKRHLVLHTGVKAFKCNVCGRIFGQRGHLKRHSVVHTGVKAFKCQVCGKAFTQSSSLKTHAVIHSDVSVIKCDVCGQRFTQTASLKRHSIIHTRVNPLKGNM